MIENEKHNELTIITTHMNADYDAVASMLAAQKLYPDALVVFSGSQEKNMRNFFISSIAYLLNMANIKDIDFDRISRLVLVDTRQPSRIGRFSELLDKPDIEIHIYDHHPFSSGDIQGIFEMYHPAGSTATIMTEILQEKGIAISPDEATILALGIYEDTGSFTYTSTTEKDFMAASFLLSKGANINTISGMISREISSEQIGLLNDLLQTAVHYNIKGVDIVITQITTDHYVADTAVLVQKMMKMESMDALFAIARMDNKIYIMARSQTSDVDVGTILQHFGGGGHTYAAACSIKGVPLTQVEQQLMDVIQKSVRSSKRAKDLMSSPVIKVTPNITCYEARDLMVRYNINTLIVAETENGKDRLFGYISRQVLSKTAYLKIDHSPVQDYMSTEVEVVEPDSGLSEIQEKIIDNKQRILPVISEDRIVGVITRTDLLNTIVQGNREAGYHLPDPNRDEIHARTRNIEKFMKERLSESLFDQLKTIGEIGKNLGYGIYVVGGFVRDLFLYRKNEDMDIVVEGDGIRFAKTYAGMVGARTHSHEKFCTAVVIFPNGFKIDVASARLEYYQSPAELPVVEMSSIKLDLFRRDFTINTLAIQLNPERFGTLIDFFSAQKDIKEKVIRALHNLSFVEDPTRVFRAIRFEQRFGFTIGKLTTSLIDNVIKLDFFRQLRGKRVFSELRQILEEEDPTPAIKRLQDYDLLSIIHPFLKPNRRLYGMLQSIRDVLSWKELLFHEESVMKWAVYFMVLIRHCDHRISKMICDKLEMPPKYQTIFCKERFDAEQCLHDLKRELPMSNSDLYHQLNLFRTELLLYMMAVSNQNSVKRAISHYINYLKHIRLTIGGKDLKQMGLTQGPLYGQILKAALNARLDGFVKTPEDEIEFVKDYVRSI